MQKFSILTVNDISNMVSAFAAISWHKPASLYEAYLSEQEASMLVLLSLPRIGVGLCMY